VRQDYLAPRRLTQELDLIQRLTDEQPIRG